MGEGGNQEARQGTACKSERLGLLAMDKRWGLGVGGGEGVGGLER